MRRSVLFWNQHILQRATIPGWYLQGFFTILAQRNSFWGVLPPMVSLRFLLAGSSLLTDGPASAAIWANCWVSDDSGNSPPPQLPHLHYPLLHLLWGWRGFHHRYWGSAATRGSASTWTSALVLTCRPFLPILILDISLFLPCWKRKPANQKPEQLCESHVASLLN